RGPLYISGVALESLSALKNLRYVSAGLYLYGNGNANVTDLAGLESLQSVGSLYVASLPSLTSLEALRNTSFQHLLGTDIGRALPEAVSGEVELLGLPKLESLSGLDSVTGLQNLTINDCDALTDLSGLSALRDVGGMRLEGNAGLLSLNGVPQLRAAYSIELVSDPNLVDISALSVLEDVKYLWVYNLLYLTDFLPLRNVRVGSVTILNMPSLQSLDGLEGLGENANVINVQNNAVLEDITALSGVRTAWQIEIRDNARLRSLAGLDGLESVTVGSEIFRNALVPQCAVDALHERIPLLEGTLNDTTATCM
ncbi:MAG TPA: hypothetical protein VFN67_21810, partial [Polyangiales bacterium]|nr:hypothetical protein [Polyangiales bacterium]